MAIQTITVDGVTYDIGVKVANITGTLPVSKGGTGVTAAPSLLTNLGSTSASNPFDSAPRPGVTGTLPISRGGTGATTAAAARTSLGLGTASTHAHGDYALASHTHDEYALTSHTHDYSKVSFTQTNTSGDEIGKITINGTTTTLYADANTDTNVDQNVTTTNATYPLLLGAISGATTTSNGEVRFRANTYENASTGRVVTNGTVSSTRTSAVGFDVQSGGNQLATLWGYSAGTTSSVGWGGVALGNTIASGTAGNARGFIYLYGTGSGLTQLDSSNTGTSTYTIHFPMISGDVVINAGNQTIAGTKTFSGQVNFAGGSTYNVSTTGTGTFNSLEAKGNLYVDQKIIGKSGTVSTGNYTTTIPTAAGTAGQIMFVLQ